MKTVILTILTVLVSACASVAPAPPNAVFVATFLSETLKGRNISHGNYLLCDETFSHAAHAASRNEICFDNSCGWSEVHLKVAERIAGLIPSEVRLRSGVGEFCQPLFYGHLSNRLVVVTGVQNPLTEGVSFEVFSLFEVGSDSLAFVPESVSTFVVSPDKLSWEQLESLLKPIPPYVFGSKEVMQKEQVESLLRRPYVCEQGDDLAYCKAILLADFKKAIRSGSR